VLDGKLGQVVHVEASDDGEELHGIVAIPKWLDSVLDERKVSATWDRATKTLKGLALVRNPRVSDAALMAAFTAAGGCKDCPDTAAEPDAVMASNCQTVDGKCYPKSDWAYTPSDTPSDWKIRLTDTPGGDPDPGIVGAAAAALSSGGFRGQKADIPSSDLPTVKRKVRAAWKKANPGKSNDDMPESIRMSQSEELSEALEAAFAPARHQTPEGQAQIQQLHDLSARYGAVCKASNTAKMASSSEAKAIQGIHDAAMAAGAMCSKVGNGGSPMYSPFSGKNQGGSKMSTVFERFMAWMGSEAPDGQPDPPQPVTAGTEKPKEATMSNEAKNEAQEREARLYAELAAEREKSARLERERIHERAVAFSDKTLKADKRILPASTEALTVLFEQLAIADNKMPAVTFSDGSTDTYVGLLSKFVATLPKSPLTEELLSGSLHETIVALANRQEAVTPDTDRQLSREELDAMLAKLPTGRSMLSERRKNGA
jgi:hypothetical protein